MVDALKKVKSKYLFFIFGGLSAAILLKNLWDLLSLNTGDLEDVALLGFAIFFATGVFVFAIKYFFSTVAKTKFPQKFNENALRPAQFGLLQQTRLLAPSMQRHHDSQSLRCSGAQLDWKSSMSRMGFGCRFRIGK